MNRHRPNWAHAARVVAPLLAVAIGGPVHAATLPGEEPPGWVLPPGREAVIEQLFTPYMDAPTWPRVVGARIERSAVRASVELAAGQTTTVELQHADTETAARAPAGLVVLASAADVDTRVLGTAVASAASPGLRQVAEAVLANRRARPVPLWEENSVKVAARTPKKTGESERPTHAGILTPEAQRVATFAALAGGVVAGVVGAVRRRRQDRRSK